MEEGEIPPTGKAGKRTYRKAKSVRFLEVAVKKRKEEIHTSKKASKKDRIGYKEANIKAEKAMQKTRWEGERSRQRRESADCCNGRKDSAGRADERATAVRVRFGLDRGLARGISHSDNVYKTNVIININKTHLTQCAHLSDSLTSSSI